MQGQKKRNGDVGHITDRVGRSVSRSVSRLVGRMCSCLFFSHRQGMEVSE